MKTGGELLHKCLDKEGGMTHDYLNTEHAQGQASITMRTSDEDNETVVTVTLPC